ncbi:MAG: glycosyltransferase family 4 protein [Alphaproteobacteria bacterium]|nr:glycosyltransferase family 4 protein [Alphaproteobacteria bacterium]
MQRPSVLFINRVYPPVRGATGRVLRDLAKAFAREGWQVTVLSSGPRPGRDRDGSIRHITLRAAARPSGLFGYPWLWLKFLVTALRLPRTDLVVTLTDPPMLAVAGNIIRKVKKNRHINWCHDLYPDIFPALNVRLPEFLMRFFRRHAYKAMREADKLIVVGRCMARHLTAGGIDPKLITFIPNWPDFELAQHGSPEEIVLNYDAGNSKPYEEQIKDSPKFRVLYAGNLGRAHPVETILQAAELLHDSNPEIEFVFVGDGPRFDHLARERVRRGLDNVRLMPFQPESKLREVMESGDLHLISVRHEAAGMLVPCKLYSALAVGRPCILIGPEKSEMAKVINDFHAGAVTGQGRPQELSSIIRHFRESGEDWFAAHEGAAAAGNVFVPKEAIDAWVQRAWGVVEQDMKG